MGDECFTKLAEDRAEQLKREPDKVVAELERRLRKDIASTGDFRRIHPMPPSGADVPDDLDARLPETYQWLLLPVQNTPQAPLTWEALRLSGSDALAVRASRKLRSDQLYLTSFAPTRLRMELDRIPLWRGEHVAVRQLVADFARYLYLPRLKDSAVLLHAISDGVNRLTWSQDGYGFADSYDEVAGRYKGLRGGSLVNLVDPHATGLVVKPEVASRQLDAERRERESAATGTGTGTAAGGGAAAGTGTGAGSGGGSASGGTSPASSRPKRSHGSVSLDANRVGRDGGKIAEEVIAHLVGLVGAQVRVTLEIAADVPDGASDSVVRTVTENARTLKFAPGSGFEKDWSEATAPLPRTPYCRWASFA